MNREFGICLLLFSALLLALLPGVTLAGDNPHINKDNHATYLFLVGVDPLEGPDVTAAPDGSTVSLSGTGMFTAGPHNTASGSGSYTITDASGNTVASGTWTVTGILGFVDYGSAIPQELPESFHGGQLELGVTLSGLGDGVLTLFCVLGTPPPGKGEGISLILGQGLNFTKPIFGQTLFIKL